MIKAIYKYYLKFPPMAHTAIDVSLSCLMGGIGVDYYHCQPRNILGDCIINKKLFI